LPAREGDVAVKGDAGVSGSEVAGDDHLLHMANGVAKEKDRTPQAAREAHASRRANREIRQAHLELERTDLPANVRRRDLRKKR
jgi:hypothetical protein